MISSMVVKMIEDLNYTLVGLSIGQDEDKSYDILVSKQGGRLIQNEIVEEGLYLISVKAKGYAEAEHEATYLVSKLKRITNRLVHLSSDQIYETVNVTVKVNQLPQFSGIIDGKFVWFFYITVKELVKW